MPLPLLLHVPHCDVLRHERPDSACGVASD